MNSIEQLRTETYSNEDEYLQDLYSHEYRFNEFFRAAVDEKLARSMPTMRQNRIVARDINAENSMKNHVVHCTTHPTTGEPVTAIEEVGVSPYEHLRIPQAQRDADGAHVQHLGGLSRISMRTDR
jgi:hypothetical protein